MNDTQEDIVEDEDGTSSGRQRKTYDFDREDSVTVVIPELTDITLVAATVQGDEDTPSPIGYRYLPKSAEKPFFSNNSNTGRPISGNLATQILLSGVVIDGKELSFADATDDDEPVAGRRSTVPMYRASDESEDGQRTVVTVRQRTRTIDGKMTPIDNEFVLNAWRVPVGEGSPGRRAVEATDDVDDL